MSRKKSQKETLEITEIQTEVIQTEEIQEVIQEKNSCPVCKSPKVQTVVNKMNNGLSGVRFKKWQETPFLLCESCGAKFQ